MRLRPVAAVPPLLLLCALGACSTEEEEPTPVPAPYLDAAVDVSPDVSSDAPDAPPDVATDPSPDALPDAAPDALDAPAEATDAPAEATDAPDDASDAPAEADAPDDVAAEASDASDAADAPVEASDASDAAAVPTCGAAPYQRFEIGAEIVTGMPQTSVTLTASACPGTTLDIPYQETVQLDVPQNKPFFFTGTQTGSLTTFTTEQNIAVSLLPTVPSHLMMLPPTYPAAVYPSWDASTMALLRVEITSVPNGAIAPCDDKSGVTFDVPGHAEAVVKYGGNGSSTGSGGDANAWIFLVTSGTEASPEYVTVNATKSGCTVGLEAVATFFVTGRAPVAKGIVTASVGYEIRN